MIRQDFFKIPRAINDQKYVFDIVKIVEVITEYLMALNVLTYPH